VVWGLVFGLVFVWWCGEMQSFGSKASRCSAKDEEPEASRRFRANVRDFC